MFNRFAHVYIETTLDSWLRWAKIPRTQYQKLDYMKDEEPVIPIHPAIYAFIYAKSRSNVDVLRTKYDGIKPNADPRKWEMASKMLYKTGNPKMLRSLVGEGMTAEFTKFCQIKIPSVHDIVNGDFKESDYRCNVDQAYLTAAVLSNVDEENLLVVRSFVQKMGLEVLTLFDEYWMSKHTDRIKIMEDISKVGLTWRARV